MNSTSTSPIARSPIEPIELSIQIVTWNSAHVIDACLDSLSRQDTDAFEVVLVDNASSDDSAARAEAWLPKLSRLSVIREQENRGFCGGQNRATSRSTGAWVLFLNPDTVLPADFVRHACAIAAAAGARVGAVAPCIMLPDGKIDSTGLAMDRFRRAYDRDRHGDPARQFAAESSVFGCTGAVALLRRAMLLDVAVDGEVLDERIFAYYDDLDLAWRATLRGWTCQYEATLVATHQRAARNAIRGLPQRKTRSRDQLLSVRNRLLVMARCERASDFILALPWLLPFELARVAYLTLRARPLLAAYVEAARELRGALAARQTIHGRAVAPLLPALPWKVR